MADKFFEVTLVSFDGGEYPFEFKAEAFQQASRFAELSEKSGEYAEVRFTSIEEGESGEIERTTLTKR